jgi:hypothetical protein
MATVHLSAKDADLIARVVATEVPASIARSDPQEYDRMVRAVVDTVLNRVSTGDYGHSVSDVLNDPRAFSKITGPSNLDPYGSVQNAPKAPASVQRAVDTHLSQRVAGMPSTIGGSVNYANPNYSSPNNLVGWINPMIEAGARKLGIGDAVHYHGTAPGAAPAGSYNVTLPADYFSLPVNLPQEAPAPELASLVARLDEAPIPGNLPSVARPDNFAAGGPSFPQQFLTAGAPKLTDPIAERFGGRGSGSAAPILAGYSFNPATAGFAATAPRTTEAQAFTAPVEERFGPPASAPRTIDGQADLANAITNATMAPSDAIDPARLGATATGLESAPRVDTFAEQRTNPNDMVNAIANATMANEADPLADPTIEAMLSGMEAPVYGAGQVAPVTLSEPAPEPVQAGFAPVPETAPAPEPAPAPAPPIDLSVLPSNPGQLGGITMSNPVGLGGPGGLYLPATAPLKQQAVTAPPPAAAPVVAAPKLPAPRTVAPRPIYAPETVSAPRIQAPPAASPYDVYGGRASSAMSASGNQVTRDAFGNTGVTNKYGITTMTTPQGQAATSSPLSGFTSSNKATIAGPLAGDTKITAPAPKNGLGWLGDMAKIGAGGLAGASAGTALAPGPGTIVGGLLGGLLTRELQKPNGGILGGLFGNNTATATATSSAGQANTVPEAPAGGTPDYAYPEVNSNRSYEEMESMFGKQAADAVASGGGGLY